ncbi:response regulator transcription factor [Algiphilus sp.]|uniref:response regulator transcription factor n=1 Tax=Algiphilus sp. TaxID=1872431 RepID=UPI003C365375
MPRILLADDDRDFCALLREYLQRQGFEVDVVHDGAGALDRVAAAPPDALVLDVMMPGLDGFQVLERLRPRHAVPVLMLTARGEDIDRIVGLEMGADDYLPKPANPRELLARLRAILRRTHAVAGSPAHERLALGDLVAEPGALRATLNGAALNLTGAELAVLIALMRHAGTPVGRETLCREALSRPLGMTDRSIDMHVSRLRGKLGPHPDGSERIRAVRNRGYCYTLPQ